MIQHGSYLQTIGKSIRCLSDHVTMKNQSKSKNIISHDDESSDSSSDEVSISRASSSPLFYSLFTFFSQGNCTGYARQKSIHEEYRSYLNTPTFIDKQIFSDLDQAKNKSIETPSEPMLHPVLLEPSIFKQEEYSKLYQRSKSEMMNDHDRNKRKNEICNFECPICLSKVKNGDLIIQAKCGHIFHHECIQPWFVEHHSCPICRAEIESA